MKSFQSTLKSMLMTAGAFACLLIPAQGQAFDQGQSKDIEKIIKEYLIANPGVVAEALQQHQINLAKADEQRRIDSITKNKKAFTSDYLPSVGNPNAKITVVEFSDYNCGYCKRAFSDLDKLVQTRKDVRFVFSELPILSQDSKIAAMWALAADKQGKYYEFHKALMEHRGAKNENTLTKIANNLGLDAAKMRKDAKSRDVKQALEKSTAIAREIGVTGTPAFIVNDDFYGGYLGNNGLEKAIQEAKSKLK